MATKLSTQLDGFFNNNRLIAPTLSPLSGVFTARASADVLAADNDADDYRLFIVSGNAIPTSVLVRNTAITGGTDWDLGIFAFADDGSVKDVNVLLDGVDLSSAGNAIYALPTLVADIDKPFWELAGDTEYTGQQYIIGWTANTVGSASGTIDTILTAKFTGN